MISRHFYRTRREEGEEEKTTWREPKGQKDPKKREEVKSSLETNEILLTNECRLQLGGSVQVRGGGSPTAALEIINKLPHNSKQGAVWRLMLGFDWSLSSGEENNMPTQGSVLWSPIPHAIVDRRPALEPLHHLLVQRTLIQHGVQHWTPNKLLAALEHPYPVLGPWSLWLLLLLKNITFANQILIPIIFSLNQ